MNEREQRGLVIAATSKIVRRGGAWMVPSQSASGKKYAVVLHPTDPVCSCPDFETRGCKCKHIFAAEFTVCREENPDGTITETRSITLTEKRTYKQNWPAYNAAQVNEKDQFLSLLSDLIRGVQEPVQNGPGRRRISQRDAIFAACFKVYSTFSGRRFISDLREATDRGHVRNAVSYNSIFKVLESEATFDTLKSLVVESAKPLAAIESTFAPDSSGFSGCRFDKWFDHKWGRHEIKRSWVKCHIMTGVKTNVVTAVEIEDKYANDGARFAPLFQTTRQSFDVKEICGDLAYSTHANLELVNSAGAVPYIPFKCNATDSSGGLWAKMFHFFSFNKDEFLARYHQRSNVESTFSMIKAKFGDGVRSKCDVAMKNEVLAKLVCHNICCLISAIYELGIEPTFWGNAAVV